MRTQANRSLHQQAACLALPQRCALVAISLFFLLLPTLPVYSVGANEASGTSRSSGELPSERGGSRERGSVEIPDGYERAVFAGGCFWCMEPPYDEVAGVYSVTSGFAGGDVENPTYREAVGGTTGHKEVVEVVYNPGEVGYRELVDIFWVNIDPLDDGGQFCDRGSVYRTAIFYTSDAQRAVAEESANELARSGRFDRDIVTPVRALEAFYPAEEYHQAYYRKNPTRYRFYRTSCGRDNRLAELWGS